MSKVREATDKIKEQATQTTSPAKEITFPTGLVLLDSLIGGGLRQGFASGDVVRLLGESKAGKTYFIMEAIAAAYHKFPKGKFKWLYDNVEGGFSFWNVTDLLGLPYDRNVNFTKSNTPREAYHKYVRFYDELKDDEFGIVAMDSLDGFMGDYQLTQLAVEQGNILDGENKKMKGELRAEIASYMSKTFFPGLTAYTDTTSPAHKNVLFIFVSQLRDNPDAAFGGRKPSGGNAAWFYSDVVLDLVRKQPVIRKDSVFENEIEVGTIGRACLKKTRTPRPERHLYYTLWFDSGVQEIETNLDYVYGLRQDKGKKPDWGQCIGGEKMSPVYWNGKKMSREKLIRLAENDPKIEEKLKDMAAKTWEKVEASVASKRRKKYG